MFGLHVLQMIYEYTVYCAVVFWLKAYKNNSKPSYDILVFHFIANID